MELYRLENNGISVDISVIGASIVNFLVETQSGKEINIVLGYDNEEQYRSNGTYIGAVVGPVANRIAMGTYTLDGVRHTLAKNDGTNHLHGGDANLNSKTWRVLESNEKGILLTTSVNKEEEGYDCDITFIVSYFLSSDGELHIRYKATPTARCPICVTQHAYFNLNGHGDVLGHSVRMDADRFMTINKSFIPNGVQQVLGTPFDFRHAETIGEALKDNHRQTNIAGGFDHCWLLNHDDFSISVFSPESGLSLEVKTDLPGVQFYSGNFLKDEVGRNGEIYNKHAGFCLETQSYPNQVNTKKVEECIFDPQNPFVSTTVYKVIRD